jgi:hypothetical protein
MNTLNLKRAKNEDGLRTGIGWIGRRLAGVALAACLRIVGIWLLTSCCKVVMPSYAGMV